MNTYPLIPSSGVQEFRSRLTLAVQDDQQISEPELRHALGALTEDDGQVDEFESNSARKLLVSDGFQRVSSQGARELARAFVDGVVPAVSDRWTEDFQARFSQQFLRDDAGVQLPKDSVLPSRSLGECPAEVRACLERGGPQASAHRVRVGDAEVYVVHARGEPTEQLTIYDARGTLLTWGSGQRDHGFFWQD